MAKGGSGELDGRRGSLAGMIFGGLKKGVLGEPERLTGTGDGLDSNMSRALGLLLGRKSEVVPNEVKSQIGPQDLHNKMVKSFKTPSIDNSSPSRSSKIPPPKDPAKMAQEQLEEIIEEMSESIHVFRNHH